MGVRSGDRRAVRAGGALAEMVSRSRCGPGNGEPLVLLISPPPVGRLTDLAGMFRGAEEKSRRFSGHYRRNAENEGCGFLDAGEYVASSDVDGIHLEAGAHRKLGEAVATRVREMLG